MTFAAKLQVARDTNNSLLCIGLDPEISKMPARFAALDEPLLAFNKDVIDVTADLVSAYKPNSAFYEAYGTTGLRQLQATIEYLQQKYPTIPVILDSKRADIGNTNNGYVKHSFDYLQADAVTLHPYLGREALEPFLARADKGIIILCRTSNPGASEFQDLPIEGKPLYQYVAQQVAEQWNTNNNCLLVVGATYPNEIKLVRDIVGADMTFLIPGIGAQGGDLAATMQAAGDNIIISASRSVLYASNGDDYAEAARAEAQKLHDDINKYRSYYG